MQQYKQQTIETTTKLQFICLPKIVDHPRTLVNNFVRIGLAAHVLLNLFNYKNDILFYTNLLTFKNICLS